jgi:hypothetical protein
MPTILYVMAERYEADYGMASGQYRHDFRTSGFNPRGSGSDPAMA